SSPFVPSRSSPLEGAWQFPDRRPAEPLELPPEDHRPICRIDLVGVSSASTRSTSREVGEGAVARDAHLHQAGISERGLELGKRMTRTEHPTELQQADERLLADTGTP